MLEEMQLDGNETYEIEEDEEIKISQSNNDILIDIDEEIYAELGTGYIKNIITSGDISAVKAILTQKRLYLSGKTYIISKNTLTKLKESKIINVEDITGTGFVYTENKLLLIISIIIVMATLMASVSQQSLEGIKYGLLGFLITAIFMAIYFSTRKSLFKIEYAGGSISFDVKWFDIKESVKFQNMIYLLKDQRKKEIIQESLNEKENT